MRMALLRRRMALAICPEMAELAPRPMPEKQLTPKELLQATRGLEMLRLDRAYSAATGAVLTAKTAPEYCGPIDRWHTSKTSWCQCAGRALSSSNCLAALGSPARRRG